jgi:hypothetical protein
MVLNADLLTCPTAANENEEANKVADELAEAIADKVAVQDSPAP